MAAALQCTADLDDSTGIGIGIGTSDGGASSGGRAGDELGEDDRKHRIVRVYIDVFAVRQWPGNMHDVVFAGVVKRVDRVLGRHILLFFNHMYTRRYCYLIR